MSCLAAALISLGCDGPRNTQSATEPPHSATSKPTAPASAGSARLSSPPTSAKPSAAAAEAPSTTPPLGGYWLSQLPKQARQLVVVSSKDWDASSATLQRFTFDQSAWQQTGEPVSVVIGKHGLGWGRGINRPEPKGPQKREGDGKAPAGLFLMNRSYGHGVGAKLDTRLEHTAVSPSWRCVDDVQSKHYGELLDGSNVKQDWKSAEKLQRSDPLYEIIVLVEHNSAHQPGAGSCIFLHTWRFWEDRPDVPRPTVGCTAMARPALVELVRWLQPGAVLAQLPEAELPRDQ